VNRPLRVRASVGSTSHRRPSSGHRQADTIGRPPPPTPPTHAAGLALPPLSRSTADPPRRPGTAQPPLPPLPSGGLYVLHYCQELGLVTALLNMINELLKV